LDAILVARGVGPADTPYAGTACRVRVCRIRSLSPDCRASGCGPAEMT